MGVTFSEPQDLTSTEWLKVGNYFIANNVGEEDSSLVLDNYYGLDFCNGGTASADKSAGISFLPSNAFDNYIDNSWRSGSTPHPHWIKYDLGDGITKVARKLRMYLYVSAVLKEFILQGSNNDTDWDNILETQTTENTPGWHEFEFYNNNAYRYYRIYTLSNWADNGHATIQEIELQEVEYYSTGYRISNAIDIGVINEVYGSEIIWVEDVPTSSIIKIYTAVTESNSQEPNEEDWIEAENGSSIPGIEVDDDLTNKFLWLKQELSTTDVSVSPTLESLDITIDGQETVIANRIYDYRIRYSVPKYVNSIYNIGESINAFKSFTYDIKPKVYSSLKSKYDLYAYVNSSLLTKYNLGFAVQNNTKLNYDLIAYGVASLVSKYNLGFSVSSSTSYVYDLYAYVNEIFKCKYNLGWYINNSLQYNYDLYSYVHDTNTYLYNLYAKIYKSLILKYNTLNTTQSSIIAIYNIYNYIFNSSKLKYKVYNYASNSKLFKYIIEEDTLQDITVYWREIQKM